MTGSEAWRTGAGGDKLRADGEVAGARERELPPRAREGTAGLMAQGMVRGVVVAVVLGAALSACVPPVVPPEPAVGMGPALPNATCESLGVVYGSSGLGYITDTTIERLERAHRDLRDQAARRGGNFVVTDMAASGSRDVGVSGVAYRCGPPSVEARRRLPWRARRPRAPRSLSKSDCSGWMIC